MDLHKLRYFVALAEELHFGNAARRLHLTQQALSTAIRTLERALGASLFVRSSRRVELTPEGAALLPEARRLLAAADGLQATVTATRSADRGVFTVGVLDEGGAELNGPIVAAFRAAYPDLSVHVCTVAWGRHRAALQAGAVDAFLGMDMLCDEQVVGHPLFVDGRLAVLPAAHPLAEADEVPAQELLDLPAPHLPGVPQRMADHFLLADLRNGESPRMAGVGECLMEDMLRQVAFAGASMTVTTATSRFYHHPGVVYRPVPDAADTLAAVLTWRDGEHRNPRRPLIDAFAAGAVETARRLVGLVPGARLPAVPA